MNKKAARFIQGVLIRRAKRRRLSRGLTRLLCSASIALAPASRGVEGLKPQYVGSVGGSPGCWEVYGNEAVIACAAGFVGP